MYWIVILGSFLFLRICFPLFLFLIVNAHAIDSLVTIVFVHIGPKIPGYLECAMMQARVFNECRIILIANEKPIKGIRKFCEEYKIDLRSCESLEKSYRHKTFAKKSKLDRNFRGGFWYLASERFFYLDDLIQELRLENVIHLESDVMLYVSLDELAETLLKNYRGIGATFDNDSRCIPGIIFIRNQRISASLTRFMMDIKDKDDMFAIGEFRKKMGDAIVKTFPIVHADYADFRSIDSLKPGDYFNLVDEFQSIFDAAFYGQYLGGEDPRNGSAGPGFINPHCVINSSFLEYSWQRDEKNRLVPFAEFNGKKLRINNLHIHSKRLWDFYSLN